MSKNEDKLQHDLIMWFSQTYPNEHGNLFMVQNTGYSDAQRMKLVSMGLIAGVSDLIYWGKLKAAIELKSIDSKHKTSHVVNQLNWGKSRIEKGDYFLMTNNLNSAKMFLDVLVACEVKIVEGLQAHGLHLVEQRIKISGKTIKF